LQSSKDARDIIHSDPRPIMLSLTNVVSKSLQFTPRDTTQSSLQQTCIATLTEAQPGVHEDRAEPGKKHFTVLLVSEDRQLYSMVRSFLEHAGLCVFVCSCVERAENTFLPRHDIDMWIIDADSLGALGLYLAVRLRDFLSDLPILLLTGEELNQSVLLKLVHNAWLRLEKPLSPTKLLAAVHGALAGNNITTRVQDSPDSVVSHPEDGHQLPSAQFQVQADWLSALIAINIGNRPRD
jgi:CheY-like chemotaxis protein